MRVPKGNKPKEGTTMSDAWMKRGGERQRFREEVQREMLDYEQDTHSQSGRAKAQIGWLIAMGNLFAMTEGVPTITNVITGENYKKEIDFFREKIFPAIDEFSRAPEETMLICAELFEWVTQSLARQAKVPYQVLEQDDPDKLFKDKE